MASVCALACIGAMSSPARAAELGVVPDLTWYIPDQDKQRGVERLEQSGSRWVRLHVQWREAEPADNRYDEWWMAEYAEAIALAHGAGQQVVVMVSEAPAWASGSSDSNAPRDPAKFAEFMAELARRFGGRVDAYEIWNEQNIRRFWSAGPDPGDYARLLRAAYPAIKLVDPGAQVVFGGVSGNDWDFVARSYAAGARGFFDVMATHPYTRCGATGPADIRRTGSGRISADSFLGYREVRAVMLENDDPKPLWLTEFGWNVSDSKCDPGAGLWQGGVSPIRQAAHLSRALELVERDGYVKVALWYGLRDNVWAAAGSAEGSYGLLRRDFSPRPAFRAFAAHARGRRYRLPTRTTLRVRRQDARRIRTTGRVRRTGRGRVVLAVQRRAPDGWRRRLALRTRLSRAGRYQTRIPRRKVRSGSLRIRAVYPGSRLHERSRSRWARVRVG